MVDATPDKTSAAIDDEVRAEQISSVFRAVPLGVLGAAAAAALLAAMLVRMGATARLTGAVWTLYIAAGAAAHLGLRHLYFARPPRAGRRRWFARGFVAISLAEGAGWGWAAIALVDSGDRATAILVLGVTMSVGAASIAAFSALLPAFCAFFFTATVPYTVLSLAASDPVQRATLPLMLVFVPAVSGIGLGNHRRFNELIRLRIQTASLVAELRIQKEIAERANVAKSKFLAAASHDLRQPVHALSLFVGALRGLALPAAADRIVEQIETSTAAMDGLFGALLDISRLDAGIVEVQPQPFPIQPLLDRIARDYTEEARDKGIGLVVKPCRGAVCADPVLVERIVRNLVSNAVRYTDHGRVVIGCRRGGALRVQVWDTGPGIAVAEREKIFQEYFQLGNTERDRAKGLGLGLAIVRRLSELTGCALTLRSWPGRGSCFSLELPLAAPGALSRDFAETWDTGASARKFVAVVDDEVAIREAMAVLLSGWGHRVITAGSGDDILNRLADDPSRPDLIICDYRLRGGETGIEAIERLRSEYNETIPAMLITGDTAPERLIEAGASGLLILHKPVPNGRLRAAIRNLTQPAPAALET